MAEVKNWLDRGTTTDVQTAIQTQTIQTALEQNTSQLSDAALQSFLSNAPIPRCIVLPTAGTLLPVSVETTINFTKVSSSTFDPYSMNTGNVFTVPIDGFYNISGCIAFAQPAAAGTYSAYSVIRSNTGKVWAPASAIALNEVTLTLYGSTTGISLPVSRVIPFRAGDSFTLAGLQSGIAAGVTTIVGDVSSALSIAWTAPYNTYTTAGGN